MDAAPLRTLSLIVAACAALSAVGCVGRASVVELVLPKNFAGEIRIVLDTSGERVSSTGGRTTFRIPESGVLRVQSLASFEEWHSLVGTFDDGQILPVAVSPSDLPAADGSTQSYLWSGHAKQTENLEENTFFVGTAKEYDEGVRRNYFGGN
ncbi:MAG TPA: hypothetical protein VGN57_09120 [Pirellulaceae bacterium]|jgi:hypothetical protein|nr:hypothetical protein [Pirellulaceae bacterium]